MRQDHYRIYYRAISIGTKDKTTKYYAALQEYYSLQGSGEEITENTCPILLHVCKRYV